MESMKTLKQRDLKRKELTGGMTTSFSVKEEKTYTAVLLSFDDVPEDLTVDTPEGRKTIIRTGYSWLQGAIRGKEYVVTVLFDEKGEYREAYFDIVRELRFEEGNVFFEDLFLDVLYRRYGSVTLLDEGELRDAVREGLLSKGDARKIRKSAHRLMTEIRKRGGDMVKEWEKLFSELEKTKKMTEI